MKTFRYVSPIKLYESKKSTIEVLRIGKLFFGGITITKTMLKDYVRNFKKDVYGQGDDIPVNLSHEREGEAAGWVRNLFIDGESLMAEIEWTILGFEKIKKNLFKFISAELAPLLPNHETGKEAKNVFIGAALTNIPALKGQRAIALSEELKSLINKNMLKKLLENYKARDIVSKEDKELLKKLLEEAPEEEKEEVKEDVAAVEAKPEEAEVSEEEKKKEEEEKAAKEAKEKEEAEAKEKEKEEGEEKSEEANKELTELSGKLDTLTEKNEKLEEKLLITELTETVKEKFVLSDDRDVGFKGDDSKKVIDFMVTLSDKQRDKFSELLALVKHVDLLEIGSTKAEDKKGGELEDKIVALTEKKMKADKKLSIEDAQKEAYKELTK